MKVLFDHLQPFLLAHGGLQIQIEETKRALEQIGVEVEFLRWWDEKQTGDIIHFFGRPWGANIDLAHSKNIRVVMSELLTGLGSRSAAAIAFQRTIIGLTKKWAPSEFWVRMGWDAYATADAIIALTNWEARLMRDVFRAPVGRVTVIPNGVANEFLGRSEAAATPRGNYLVCSATITERKRVLETAEAAVQAETPLHVLGKPYSHQDRYAQQFLALVKEHPAMIRYEGAIQDRSQLAQIYRQARGFVLLSTKESLSLSALEAAACECPLLLSDLPWARTTFHDTAWYCPVTASIDKTAAALRSFYNAAPGLMAPRKPQSWDEVARQLETLYQRVLSAR
jgi:glycosyltransferase involved in cell wall biosynthesis